MRTLLTGAVLSAAMVTSQTMSNVPDFPNKPGVQAVDPTVVENNFLQTIREDQMMQQVISDLTNLNQLNKLGRSTNATRSQTDMLNRFVDLKKLVSWLQPIDKRISRYCFYGCWCLPEGAHEFIAGQGKPVDLVDKSCYQLWQCYTCAKEAFNNNGYFCNPNTRKYSRDFFYDTNNPNDYAARGITCLNPFQKPNTGQNQKINCARAICECDKHFSMRLYKYHTFWSKTRHRIWSRNLATPFIVADDCHFCQGANCGGSTTDHDAQCCGDFTEGTRYPWRNHGGVLECCNEGLNGGFAWFGTMFNTLTHCCVNGAVSASCTPVASGSGATSVACNNAVVDIIMVLDESGSVGSTNFDKNIAFVNDLVSDFDMSGAKTRVAGVRFHHQASVIFDFIDNKAAAITAFDAIVYGGGGTAINNALQVTADALSNGGLSFRRGVKTVAIVMTDGFSGDGINPGANNLRAAKGAGESDVLVIGVGIGGGVNNAQIELMATDPDADNAIFATGYDALQAVKDSIGVATCAP